MVEVIFDNLSGLTQGIGAAILLPIEQMRSGWVYAFDFVYEFLSKFVSNIVVRLKDMVRAFAHATQDIIFYMMDFAAIIAATLGGDNEKAMIHAGEVAKRGFLKGFEFTDNNELFIAPPLRISEWEKTLQGMVDGMNTSIFEDFDAKFSERMNALNVGLQENPLEAKVELKPKGLSDLSKMGLSSEMKVLQATESRLLTRGATDDPLLKMSEKQLQVLQELLNAALRQIDNKDPQIILEGVN
jgi:hypothetical protein